MLLKAKAYGDFVKKGEHTYRKSAYLQWGDSEESLGACLMLNPGSATITGDLLHSLQEQGYAKGRIKTEDPTMRQLIRIVEAIYEKNSEISGRFHIYNLFTLRHTNAEQAIKLFESHVDMRKYPFDESLVSKSELQQHPWLLLGWGLNQKSNWTNLKGVKQKWLEAIEAADVPVIGKKDDSKEDYYHPAPQLNKAKERFL
ncbi:DUF1643 domain-containing protein [Halobacillus sp. A1]|uniref:DUF1643 domain-containing protein n=1 Tax=Halobacillus sp. A1 TaxID=2880262 RepID=UPI0020A639E7|nr:DUF1643 domain-containing protein [Halobacillus sp. A1]MCP3029844.1 DUF1643 domain-containing protein [Halobacillus sp. A1]